MVQLVAVFGFEVFLPEVNSKSPFFKVCSSTAVSEEGSELEDKSDSLSDEPDLSHAVANANESARTSTVKNVINVLKLNFLSILFISHLFCKCEFLILYIIQYFLPKCNFFKAYKYKNLQ